MNSSIERIYELGLSHNAFAMTLPDGTFYPDHIPSIDPRPMEFLEQFNRVRDKDWEQCSFLDLGCSEGTTTLGISQMGSEVYGVEGRADGILRAKALADIAGFDRAHFAVGNVNEESSFREVDGIFNAGILYHLDKPIPFLENTAKNARNFIYLDTGHAPSSKEEHDNSKFLSNFGKTYTIKYNGLNLDVIDFAEPATPEKKGGLRRGPRSSIGNTNSVWLTLSSLKDLMAELGFPYHETIKYVPIIPRTRTMFFREKPREASEIRNLTKPLTRPMSILAAAKAARKRDIEYLKSKRQSVLVIGRDPLLNDVCEDLKSNDIGIREIIVLPGKESDPVVSRRIFQLLDGYDGYIVNAINNTKKAHEALITLDRFKYSFSSFAMVKMLESGVSA